MINGLEGNHRGAVALLETLFPLACSVRASQPHLYYDYLNSLAVELCEVERLEEARNVSKVVLASPFAPAYPEWQETREEIELKARRASRWVVAIQRSEERGRRPESRRQKLVGRQQTAVSKQSENVVALSEARREPLPTPLKQDAAAAGRVIKFPSESTREELVEKLWFVRNEMFDMFRLARDAGPHDRELIERLLNVILYYRKQA
ncbi:MAG TPA: hypothetical protein VGL29_11270 [Blastocatellia bacterium]